MCVCYSTLLSGCLCLQDVVNPTADMTRNTVQKSVCVLSKLVSQQSMHIIEMCPAFCCDSEKCF